MNAIGTTHTEKADWESDSQLSAGAKGRGGWFSRVVLFLWQEWLKIAVIQHGGAPKNTKHLSLKKRLSAGFSLLEMSMALALAAIATAGMIEISSDSQSQIKAYGAAEQIKQVYQAAENYLQANAQTIATLVGGGVISIPVAQTTPGGLPPPGYGPLPSLQGGGFLPGSFVNSNGYGQQMVLLFRRDPMNPGNIEGLVATIGGSPITDNNLGRIANRIGAAGGAYMAHPPQNTPVGTIAGVGGGWSTPASGWSSASGSLTYGHAMAYLSSAQAGALADYLYRYNIGIPEANTMNTDINMSGAAPGTTAAIRNNINGAGTVDTEALTNTGGSEIAVTNDMALTGKIGTVGLDPEIGMPPGWAGGVHTYDAYAEGTLGAGQGGQVNSYLNSSGYGAVSQNFVVGNSLSVNNGANISNGVFLTGNALIDWPNYGMYLGPSGNWLWWGGPSNGGFAAQNFFAAGNVSANGIVEGNQGIATGLYANQGWGCGPNGLIAINNNGGGMLFCTYGTWQTGAQSPFSQEVQYSCYGQTWVGGQNNSGVTQFITAWTGAVRGGINAYVNYSTVAQQIDDMSGGGAQMSVSFVVPNGAPWSVNEAILGGWSPTICFTIWQ